MITVNMHANGNTFVNATTLADIDTVLTQEDALLWLDVDDPDEGDVRFLQQHFGFHPLALEDVTRQHQRPKVDAYDGYSLLIFYALACPPGPHSAVTADQIGLFFGSNYVVTIHDNAISTLAEIRQRWHTHGLTNDLSNVGMLVYTILDAIVDGYFPVIDQLSERLDELDEHISQHVDFQTQQTIFQIKKELVRIRRVVAPERDVLNVLVRRDVSMFEPAVILYLQDVYDHILRVTDAVDTYRDLLSSSLEFQLAVTSNKLNQVMKTLTAASIILMSMTLVASVYGMNFVHMPELGWTLGYAWALGLMAVIGGGVFAIFKRIDWI